MWPTRAMFEVMRSSGKTRDAGVVLMATTITCPCSGMKRNRLVLAGRRRGRDLRPGRHHPPGRPIGPSGHDPIQPVHPNFSGQTTAGRWISNGSDHPQRREEPVMSMENRSGILLREPNLPATLLNRLTSAKALGGK